MRIKLNTFELLLLSSVKYSQRLDVYCHIYTDAKDVGILFSLRLSLNIVQHIELSFLDRDFCVQLSDSRLKLFLVTCQYLIKNYHRKCFFRRRCPGIPVRIDVRCQSPTFYRFVWQKSMQHASFVSHHCAASLCGKEASCLTKPVSRRDDWKQCWSRR